MQRTSAAAAVAAALIVGAAQAPRPAFEAASVKVTKSTSPIVRISMPPGRLSVVNATLRMLIRNAYLFQDFRMSGGPGWLDTTRFDVEATAGASMTADQIRAMERTLLEDRFGLKTHVETRELPIYVLSVTRRDGKLGDRIKQSGEECAPLPSLSGAPPPPPPPAGPANAAQQCPSILAAGNFTGRKLTIARMATTLSQFVNREIVDRTNLSGAFDFELRWLPDQPIPPGAPQWPVDTNAPSLFAALPEQLGLKLEPSRAPVEVLVIDGAERPTED
jgi:uncharacterized protein (TIGR03435 family)